jgi:hypothetical protein
VRNSIYLLLFALNVAAFEPRVSPRRTQYTEPQPSNCNFHDLRLSGMGGFWPTWSADVHPRGAAAYHAEGGYRNDLRFDFDYVRGLTSCKYGGFVWSLGFDIGWREGDVLAPSSTLATINFKGSLGYVLQIHRNSQLELAPMLFVGAGVFDDHLRGVPPDTTSAFLWGGGARFTFLYTFENGVQLGNSWSYSYWTITLARDYYNVGLTVQEWCVGLLLGKRFF